MQCTLETPAVGVLTFRGLITRATLTAVTRTVAPSEEAGTRGERRAPRWAAPCAPGSEPRDALRVAFEKPLADFQAAETASRVADAGHGASVLSGHVALRAFKRDLLSMGMSSVTPPRKA